MFKFNSQGIPDSRQSSIDGVKEVVATCIVLRSDPFGLHYPPQGFRKVQVGGIRRKIKEEKPASMGGSRYFTIICRINTIVRRKETTNFVCYKNAALIMRLIL